MVCRLFIVGVCRLFIVMVVCRLFIVVVCRLFIVMLVCRLFIRLFVSCLFVGFYGAMMIVVRGLTLGENFPGGFRLVAARRWRLFRIGTTDVLDSTQVFYIFRLLLECPFLMNSFNRCLAFPFSATSHRLTFNRNRGQLVKVQLLCYHRFNIIHYWTRYKIYSTFIRDQETLTVILK
uniref:Uncharacterized protein n=1 Tax=Cacopsylla melanoneura TaxID=428564 RepID=A0A8D8T5I2_9HEMI